MATGLDVLLGGADAPTGLDVLLGGNVAPRMNVSPVDQPLTLRPFGFDTGVSMSPGVSRFLAGTGKGLTDVGQGLSQAVGFSDNADVLAKRRLDQALQDTTGGKWGSVVGNVAAMLPTALIPGANTMAGAALIGGGSGLVQPSTSVKEALMNTGLGTVAGPLAVGAGRAVGAGYQGVKALLAPFFQNGQEAIAARALQASATDPVRAAANIGSAPQLVPGSAPTTAQAALDPGLAQLERTLRGMPEMAAPFQMNDAAQRAARANVLENIAGRGSHYEDITKGRSVFANEDYANAVKQGIDPKTAQAFMPQIQSLMERPSIQQAQKDAIRLAKENGIALSESPAGSLQGLDWIKKALDNKISIAANPGSSIGKEELRALLQTKGDLMSLMEQLSPAYKQANQNYAQMSGQVNSMDVARDLMGRLQQQGSEYIPGGGKEMTSAFMRALSQSKDSVRKATGMNQSIGDVMPKADLQAIENVAHDLGRKAFVQDAGRAVGSPTAQNLASQNLLQQLLGPTGMPKSWAESTLLQSLIRPYGFVAKAGEPKIQGLLAQAMADPQLGRALLSRAAGQPGPMTQFGIGMQPYLPMTGGLLSNTLAAQIDGR